MIYSTFSMKMMFMSQVFAALLPLKCCVSCYIFIRILHHQQRSNHNFFRGAADFFSFLPIPERFFGLFAAEMSH